MKNSSRSDIPKEKRKHFKFTFEDLFYSVHFVYVMQVCEGAHGGQKRALESPKTGCESPTVDGENQTCVLFMSTRAPNL